MPYPHQPDLPGRVVALADPAQDKAHEFATWVEGVELVTADVGDLLGKVDAALVCGDPCRPAPGVGALVPSCRPAHFVDKLLSLEVPDAEGADRAGPADRRSALPPPPCASAENWPRPPARSPAIPRPSWPSGPRTCSSTACTWPNSSRPPSAPASRPSAPWAPRESATSSWTGPRPPAPLLAQEPLAGPPSRCRPRARPHSGWWAPQSRPGSA